MTAPVPPAERNTPGALVRLIVETLEDLTRAKGVRQDGNWIRFDSLTEKLLNDLSAAGYRIVKANPTVADIVAEQGVAPFDPATFRPFDPPLTDQEHEDLMDALAEVRGEADETEWGIRYDEGVVRVIRTREDAAECVRIINRNEGPTAAQLAKRHVGPWLPVDEENRNDG